ncbi:uncharacterized protein LOC124133770 [Haliotis rufescens]|uniref:uncharacterized protein LOC124133770 n=1 Tax=Haliotis rufescens TaxID=6454 RepID=UPI00201F3CB1|nr:uncharacterized protein LOC124133770 [Haliotis rufescens]
MDGWLKFAVTASLLCLSYQSSCKSTPPSVAFQNTRFFGLWYEVGKIQTAGGALFEKDCVCTTIDVKPTHGSSSGDATVVNSCRKSSPSGSFLNATGTLTAEGPQGKWKESFFFFAPKVDYTVIYLDDQYAIEYDCGSFLGMTNYCVHFLARKPSIGDETLQLLQKLVYQLQINTENLPYKVTNQVGCW